VSPSFRALRFLERKLAADPPLTLEESRLADTLAVLILRWSDSGRYGRQLLRNASGLHGRSLERALAGLVEKGLLVYRPSRSGGTQRSLYVLILKDSPEPLNPGRVGAARVKSLDGAEA
jgi:hypothetical protein